MSRVPQRRRLPTTELEAIADTSTIVAGFRVPERSVRTAVIADGLVEALRAEPQISLELSTRVSAVTAEGSTGSSWRLQTTPECMVLSTFVVNALWARPAGHRPQRRSGARVSVVEPLSGFALRRNGAPARFSERPRRDGPLR
jgi:hypothetical protein